MINTKLLLMEYAVQSNSRQDAARLEAIKSIRNIISQIDFNAEVVPTEDPHRLIKLVQSLKGEELNSSEIDLVYEIAGINKKRIHNLA